MLPLTTSSPSWWFSSLIMADSRVDYTNLPEHLQFLVILDLRNSVDEGILLRAVHCAITVDGHELMGR